MALARVWTPTGNYSGGGKKRLIVLHTTEGFTGPNGASDCAIYFQSDCGASSQVVIDNHHPGKLWEGVSRANGSWTQCGYNSVSVSAEQCGYASWPREKWLNEQSTLLHVTAQWIAEEAGKLGIPIKELTDSQAQSGQAGITYHSRLGSDGCGHSDPGSGYPLDQVIAWAKGGSTAPPPEQEEDEMYAVAIPPGAGADDTPDVAVSLDRTNITAVGLGADVDRMGEDAVVKVRVAWRLTSGSWGVATATLTATKPRTVVNMTGGKIDTVSFRRQDDVQITLYPNFA